MGRLFQRRGPVAAKARSPRRELVLIKVHLKVIVWRSKLSAPGGGNELAIAWQTVRV